MYYIEPDPTEDDNEYKGSVTFCYATALLHMKHDQRNRGLEDPALRNDPKIASQFQFQALEVSNLTDIHRPIKHDLSKSPFVTGQNTFTLKDLQEMVLELNQRASSGTEFRKISSSRPMN